jgi:hypothetical protein
MGFVVERKFYDDCECAYSKLVMLQESCKAIDLAILSQGLGEGQQVSALWFEGASGVIKEIRSTFSDLLCHIQPGKKASEPTPQEENSEA